MTKWEYKTSIDKLSDMNTLGFEGWELVSVSSLSGVQVCYYKRELTGPFPQIIPGCDPTCEHEDPTMGFHSIFVGIEGDIRGYCGTFNRDMTPTEVDNFIKRNKIREKLIERGEI